jgi:secernin
MCDTAVALGNATADGSVIFGKNSDREPNEAHQVILIPAASHPDGAMVRCTYREVPQVAETHAVLLAKPFWIWGAEMGANEKGVVIGNEALFTRVPYDRAPGLIGMDFIRLALERAATAAAARDTIIALLEQYGQGGNGGFAHRLFYHNSFLIADPTEAWVLETAGRHWAAERVRAVRSISNAITIGSEWDMASDDLVKHAVERRWCRGRTDFHFGRCYSDPVFTHFSDARRRQRGTSDRLQAHEGRITPQTMMAVLRDHGEECAWTPARGIRGAKVCMHAGYGPIRTAQSVGSMVSHLHPQRQTHWVTATAAPCTSIFKPVWFDGGLPDLGPAPKGAYDAATLFWRHEILHRETLRDWGTRWPLYQQERQEMEEAFYAAAERADTSAQRGALTADCFARADDSIERWLASVRAIPRRNRLPLPYRVAWQRFNREARLELSA